MQRPRSCTIDIGPRFENLITEKRKWNALLRRKRGRSSLERPALGILMNNDGGSDKSTQKPRRYLIFRSGHNWRVCSVRTETWWRCPSKRFIRTGLTLWEV